MAAGIEIYNSAGKLIIDSNNKHTVVSTLKNVTTVTDTGYYVLSTNFGNGSNLGFLPYQFLPEGMLRWGQLNSGQWCFPGASMWAANSGRFMISDKNGSISSGYLDVFNSSGTLIWSAASAGSMPRIVDFMEIPAGTNLQGVTYSKTLSYNPWFLQNSCPGNLSDDGEVTGYSGVCLKWTGTQLQVTYICSKQTAYTSTPLYTYGLKIPLAVFTGY